MLYLVSALIVCTLAALSLLAFRIGDRRGYKRCASRDPYFQLDLMFQENAMVKQSAAYLQQHIDVLNKTLQPAMNAVENGMYRTLVERNVVKDHVIRKFVDTCNDIGSRHRYEIRSGPWTRDEVEKFLVSTLDALYVRNITIADAVAQIMERVYFDPPKPAHKIPVTPE